jgi:hypothetical protein
MIFNIPIDPVHPSFTQETDLDGTTYVFLFRWNAREEAWYLTLSTIDSVIIAASLKLVSGAALLRHIPETPRPPGELFLDGVATRTNLGTDVHLTYFDADALRDLV